jgi:hypothetical protein
MYGPPFGTSEFIEHFRGSHLTRKPGRFKPSDSFPILQYGSGPHSDLLTKILRVETQLFLCNTRFYFPLS